MCQTQQNLDAEQLDLWRSRSNPASLQALITTIEPAIYRLAQRFARLSCMDQGGLANDARWRAIEAFDEFDPEHARAALFPFVYQRMVWRLMEVTKDEAGIVRVPRNKWQRPQHAVSLSDPAPAAKIARIPDPSPHLLDGMIQNERIRAVRAALNRIGGSTAKVLRLRAKGVTLVAVGIQLGISREQVRKLEALGLCKLRRILLSTAAMSSEPARDTQRPISLGRGTPLAP